MSISMAGFTANDAICKAIAAGSMSMAQVMFVRGLFASVLILLVAWKSGALRPPALALEPFVALRSMGEVFATLAFLNALANLPIADVSAVLQALPLAVTMGAAMFFGEPVGWRRWTAILVGFTGVLIVIRPGFEGFSLYSISVLVCVFFCAVRDLATRKVPAEIPSLFISTVTALAVTVVGGLLVVPSGGWSPVTWESAGLLLAAAVLILIGYQFIILGMREGEISFVAPFRYTALIWSILFGVLVFGDVPDGFMLLGAAIIVGSGLYTLYRERYAGGRKPAAESTTPAMGADGL